MTGEPNDRFPIRLFAPPVRWLENDAGEKHIANDGTLVPPAGYTWAHEFDPRFVVHSVLRLEPDGSSTPFARAVSSWDERLVRAMIDKFLPLEPTAYTTENGIEMPAMTEKHLRFSVVEAITIAASACERCINALLWFYSVRDDAGNPEGYPARSAEFAACNTRCQFCATEAELNAIADATDPGETFFDDTARKHPELFHKRTDDNSE